jgi:hypothetical protein
MYKADPSKQFSQSQIWTIEKLHRLRTKELVELFKILPAPVLREMNGEYRGHYFGVDNHPVSNILWHASANWNLFSGVWQGKSFQPVSDTMGYGFNNMKKFGMIARRWPMRTGIGSSRYDGKDVFALNYRYYYSAAGIVSMQDEIRRVQEGLYLGVGHWQLPIGIPMASIWFALTGPVGVFDSTGGRL